MTTIPTTTTPAAASFRARQAAQRATLRALSAEIGGTVRASADERLDGWVAALTSGQITKNGKAKNLTVSDAATLILKVCKVDPAKVPAEVRARFPWGGVSRDTLASLATNARVEPAVFFAGLGLVPEAPVPEAPAPEASAPEAPAPEASAPEASAPEAPPWEQVIAASAALPALPAPIPINAAAGRRGRGR